LLEPEVLRSYNSYPERLRQLIEAQPQIHTIVIDEVQKLPELLLLIRALIERNKQPQFVLTGSSARSGFPEGVSSRLPTESSGLALSRERAAND
jgi:predicted AAA+ superfamily ATPase